MTNLVERLRGCVPRVTPNTARTLLAQAADEITRLTAALGERGWRPIESAPRDGTRFLAFWQFDVDLHPREFTEESCQITFWDRDGFGLGYWRDLRDWIDGTQPSHWQPLPAAPAPEVTR